MIIASTWLTFAFVLGLMLRLSGLPPLVGYLIAGFILSALGYEGNGILEQVAHAGVLVLLFSVGLKLRLKSLMHLEVFAGSILHMLVYSLLLVALMGGLLHLSGVTVWLVPIALAFSSTVVAAKVLEARRELRALHGRIAIGILILQDLVAVAVLSLLSGTSPSPWAFLLVAFFVVRPVIHKLLELSGHDELLILYGLVLALVLGGGSFAYFGLSAELGALVLGVILADHKRAVELSNALWGLKEVLLVGFFLQIGLSGHPDLTTLAQAALLVALLPLKALLFFFILLLFRLRARSAFLASLNLATYSEFGLIIANLATEQGLLGADWLAVLAVAVAISFAITAPLNRSAHTLYKRWEPTLLRFESHRRHRDDQHIDLGDPDVLIIGMGRVGTGAYDFLSQRQGRVSGLDSDPIKAEQNRKAGRDVHYADAEDPGLWEKLVLGRVRAILLAVPDLEAKRFAARQLRSVGFRGLISATAVYTDEVSQLQEAGVDRVYNYFAEVGVGFAEHVMEDLSSGPSTPAP